MWANSNITSSREREQVDQRKEEGIENMKTTENKYRDEQINPTQNRHCKFV